MTSRRKTSAKKTIRVLSIDGGGIRGVVPAMVLEHLEQRTGRRVAEQFDVIAGTSTGGIIALMLCAPGRDGRPRYSAADVVRFYVEHGCEIFARPPSYARGWGKRQDRPKYPAASIERGLARVFGRATLRDAVTDVFVSAFDLTSRHPYIFARPTAPDADDFYLRDVARATTAFPGLFPPAEIASVDGRVRLRLLDGGVISANPAALALASDRIVEAHGERLLVVSLGTGYARTPLPWDEIQHWGPAQWMEHGALVDVLFEASSQGAATIAALPSLTRQAFRFQVGLPSRATGTDDLDPGAIAALQNIARAAIEGRGHLTIGRAAARAGWPGLFDELTRALAGPRAVTPARRASAPPPSARAAGSSRSPSSGSR